MFDCRFKYNSSYFKLFWMWVFVGLKVEVFGIRGLVFVFN